MLGDGHLQAGCRGPCVAQHLWPWVDGLLRAGWASRSSRPSNLPSCAPGSPPWHSAGGCPVTATHPQVCSLTSGRDDCPYFTDKETGPERGSHTSVYTWLVSGGHGVELDCQALAPHHRRLIPAAWHMWDLGTWVPSTRGLSAVP